MASGNIKGSTKTNFLELETSCGSKLIVNKDYRQYWDLSLGDIGESYKFLRCFGDQGLSNAIHSFCELHNVEPKQNAEYIYFMCFEKVTGLKYQNKSLQSKIA